MPLSNAMDVFAAKEYVEKHLMDLAVKDGLWQKADHAEWRLAKMGKKVEHWDQGGQQEPGQSDDGGAAVGAGKEEL